jgi:putative ATP-dependent endonuclease of the OLD family
MKLTYFSIKDYRSISKAELRNLKSTAILIGPNNEGKSNILQGLNACLMLLGEGQFTRSHDSLSMRYDRESYDWQIDYPIAKQERDPHGESVFVMYFSLTGAEQQAFQAATGSSLNNVLPIELRFGLRDATFKVLKQGRGGKTLSKKREKICQFITTTLDYVYIPAVRTAESSQGLVNTLVSRELRVLDKNPRYLELIREVDALQKPVLDNVASRLRGNLAKFIGKSLKNVELSIPPPRTRFFRREAKIIMDDGTPTALARKGDGFQSLTAISLMIGALEESSKEKDIILLIEEPESHLHPKAIHQLREILDTMREENQVVITTHNPLFVNRGQIASNFVVSQNNAVPAESLSQIRDLLGVRASDNLRHAALVVVVEGSEDAVALEALLSHFIPELRKAVVAGSLAFDVLGGASKLPYALSLLQGFLCNYVIFLDDDAEGRKAYKDAEQSRFANSGNTTFTKCLERNESEFEDLLDPEFYAPYFQETYAVDVRIPPFNQKKKWSDRIRFGMTKAGKPWPEEKEYVDKRAIADLVVANPSKALHLSKVDLIKAFAQAVQNRLAEISTGLRP